MLALHKARLMGFRAILLTNNSKRYFRLKEVAADVIECDTNDFASIQKAIQTHIKLSQICGITTTSDFYVEMVAMLSSIYNFPGNPPEALRVCRNKALTRTRLAEAGIQQPQFFIVRSVEEVRATIARLGLPCIVKPVDDSGSNNVKLCFSDKDVLSLVAHILSIKENMRGQRTAQTVLLEQFVDAPEYSVEMFSYRGKTTCIGITEKKLTGFPFFVEARHIFPAPLAPNAQEEIILTVQRALETVGLQNGPTHTEIKLTKEGCSIIEINARLAGGMIPELIRYSTNTDMLETQICMATNQKVAFDAQYSQISGIQFIIAEAEGFLYGIEGVNEASQIPGVKHVVTTCKPGQHMRLPQSAYDRLGYAIAATDTYEETEQALVKALRLINILEVK